VCVCEMLIARLKVYITARGGGEGQRAPQTRPAPPRSLARARARRPTADARTRSHDAALTPHCGRRPRARQGVRGVAFTRGAGGAGLCTSPAPRHNFTNAAAAALGYTMEVAGVRY